MLSVLCIIFFVKLELIVHASSPAHTLTALQVDAFNSKPNKSMVVATLPLRLTLCKLAAVAAGKTKEDLTHMLGSNSDKKVKSCFRPVQEMLMQLQQADLILMNKIFVNYSSAIDGKFSANSSGAFGVDVERVSFNLPKAVTNFINSRVSSATYRRIRDVIETTDITNKTKMILITAAYYKATWEDPFEIKLTKYRKFYGLQNKIIEIPMMVRRDSFLQYENRFYKALTTNLRSSGASFTVVVPTMTGSLARFLSSLKENPNLLEEVRSGMTRKLTRLVLPRLKIKTTLDYTDIFRNSSLKEILNTNSTDLNYILTEESRSVGAMFVSKIKQKIFLEVDEFGVTREMNSYMGFMKEPTSFFASNAEFVADRPFYFSFELEQRESKADSLTTTYHQLFCGVYYGPE